MKTAISVLIAYVGLMIALMVDLLLFPFWEVRRYVGANRLRGKR